MKEAILGPRYELSVASVGSSVSRRLNRVHRGKDKPANVLSFPLSKHSGEILLDLAQARKDASLFAMSPRAFLGRLFIHGALHLKGFAHGGIMEKKNVHTRRNSAFAYNTPFTLSMARRHIETGIDIGSSNVRVVVSEYMEGATLPIIIGTGIAEARGMRHGYIVNIPETVESIRLALAQAEKSSAVKIKEHLSLSAASVWSRKRQAARYSYRARTTK